MSSQSYSCDVQLVKVQPHIAGNGSCNNCNRITGTIPHPLSLDPLLQRKRAPTPTLTSTSNGGIHVLAF